MQRIVTDAVRDQFSQLLLLVYLRTVNKIRNDSSPRRRIRSKAHLEFLLDPLSHYIRHAVHRMVGSIVRFQTVVTTGKLQKFGAFSHLKYTLSHVSDQPGRDSIEGRQCNGTKGNNLSRSGSPHNIQKVLMFPLPAGALLG